MIYKASISPKSSRRTLRKLAKKLFSLGIGFVATEDDPCFAELFTSFGLFVVTGHDLPFRLASEMSLLFAEAHRFDKSFFICGGSFFSATRTVLRLFEETDGVFLSCADFDAVSEAVADACGAVLREAPSESSITINLHDDSFFISRDGVCATLSDFSFLIPGLNTSGIPAQCIPALVESLEICGFLGNNEIKCELLSK